MFIDFVILLMINIFRTFPLSVLMDLLDEWRNSERSTDHHKLFPVRHSAIFAF